MLPLLPTTVVGSYSVPEWLERLKTDYYRNRISRSHLREIHAMAIKAALKDQETAGIDIVADGGCTSATATATPGRPGKAITTFCSPRCSTRTWISLSSNSAARATRTCT